jgi:hypothetical protein
MTGPHTGPMARRVRQGHVRVLRRRRRQPTQLAEAAGKLCEELTRADTGLIPVLGPRQASPGFRPELDAQN